jgi:hypothetical protein
MRTNIHKQLADHYSLNGIPEDVNWSVLDGTAVRESLLLDDLRRYSWCTEAYKRGMAAGRVINQIFNTQGEKSRLTMKAAVESGLMPDYPIVEAPYRMFHMYDTAVGLKIIGVIQEGGASNRTRNVQTLTRLAMETGEELSIEDMLKILHVYHAPYLRIEPEIKVYVLGVVHKVTKENK